MFCSRLVGTESRFSAFAVRIASVILRTARLLCVLYAEICVNATAEVFSSPEILHHTGTKEFAFHSLLSWTMLIPPIFTASLIHLSLKCWADNVLFELGRERVNRALTVGDQESITLLWGLSRAVTVLTRQRGVVQQEEQALGRLVHSGLQVHHGHRAGVLQVLRQRHQVLRVVRHFLHLVRYLVILLAQTATRVHRSGTREALGLAQVSDTLLFRIGLMGKNVVLAMTSPTTTMHTPAADHLSRASSVPSPSPP